MATKHAKFDTDWLTKSEYKHWLEKRTAKMHTVTNVTKQFIYRTWVQLH